VLDQDGDRVEGRTRGSHLDALVGALPGEQLPQLGQPRLDVPSQQVSETEPAPRVPREPLPHVPHPLPQQE
jgi:hypothetical protein